MRYITTLVALAVLLAGCFSPSRPPGAGKLPTDPDGLFTGEPTTVRVDVISPGATSSMQTMSLFASSASGTHTLVIGTPVRNTAGHTYSTKFTTLHVDPSQAVVSQAFDDVPADRGHDFTAIRYDIDGRLVEFGRASGVDAPIGALTEVGIPMITPDFDLDISERIPGGSKVLDFVSITPANPDDGAPMLYGSVFLGLKPWSKNGGIGETNGQGEAWVTDEAEKRKTDYNETHFKDVPVDTALYYQVRLCIGHAYLPKEHREQLQCIYIPDLEAGEQLDSVLLVPAD